MSDIFNSVPPQQIHTGGTSPEAPWAAPTAPTTPPPGVAPEPIVPPMTDASAWGTPPGAWPTVPYPQPIPPARKPNPFTTRSMRGLMGAVIAIVVVVARIMLLHNDFSGSSGQNRSAPAGTSPSIAALNVCISAGEPLETMFNALSSTSDPASMAAAVQTAIGQEENISAPLPAGPAKTALTKTIADLQTTQTDVAAGDYGAETTDMNTLSSDSDAISATCGF